MIDGALHVRAVDRGDLVANRIFHRLSPTPRGETRATIRARVRWLAGFPEILLRMKGNYLEVDGRLDVPENLGTPGAPNSRMVANAAPSITGVSHSPVLPEENEAVTVTATIADVDGVGRVTLNYRIDPSTTIASVEMASIGGGLYQATLPGQASRTLAAFTIEAEDAHATAAATATFPLDAPKHEALILFGDGDYEAERFGTYRIWMTQATVNDWRTRAKMSNEPLPVTFVCGGHRVVYTAGSWFSGSAFTSPGYDSPVGRICGYDVEFPSDERFLGAKQLTLDFPIRDPTAQREQLMYWFADRLGLPTNYRRHVHVFVNGIGNRSRTGWGTNSNSIYEDVQQPGADLIEEYFPDHTEGNLYKGDYWHEFDDGGSRIDPSTANSLAVFNTDNGTKKPARYRWNWRPRATGQTASDFAPLFELVDAVNLDPASPAWPDAVESLVDVENWLRTFALNDLSSNWDSFGNGGAKNTFHYKPADGRWSLMSWDFDVGLGVFNDPTSAAIFSGGEVQVRNFERDPIFVRHYWQALHEAVYGFFQSDVVDAYTAAKHEALTAAGVRVTAPTARSGESGLSIPNWVNTRRNFLLNQMAKVTDVPFVIDHVPGDSSEQLGNLLVLSGTAPVQVADLQVNGNPLGVRWTDTNSWEAHLFLESGINTLRIAGVDRYGNEVADALRTLTVNVTGTVEPVAGNIVINEIMFQPADAPGAQYVELYNRSSTTAYALANWSIPEIGLRFPAGAVIAPSGYALAALDAGVFSRVYGSGIAVAGAFSQPVEAAGGTLTLIRSGADGLEETMNRAEFLSGQPAQDAAFGKGASLQLLSPDADNSIPGNWIAIAASASAGPLIAMDGDWRYFQNGAPPEGWATPGFDDISWAAGKGPLGVSAALLPSPIGTPLTLGLASYYFRADFDITGDPAAADFALRTLVDDGVVVYVNGAEAVRLRLGDGAVSDQTFARPAVGDAEIEGPFPLDPGLFVSGRNVIAAEVHQSVLNSADLVFGLELAKSGDGAAPASLTPGAVNSVIPGTETERLRIKDFTVKLQSDGNVAIHFTAPGAESTYSVQVSDDLQNWQSIADGIVSGTVFNQIVPAALSRYYRVAKTP
ncbi:MAG: CotH kinase family protein [Verrucomicrobiales bacterium]